MRVDFPTPEGPERTTRRDMFLRKIEGVVVKARVRRLTGWEGTEKKRTKSTVQVTSEPWLDKCPPGEWLAFERMLTVE